ncbi:MAG TPA: SRPBCC family protein [Myxococcales bacterium]
MAGVTADRIEKTVLLRAPRQRVWNAIADAKQFGSWFGAAFDGAFAAGARLTGKIVPTRADAEVAKAQQAYAGKTFEVTIDRIEPMRLFSFRWHPYAVDPAVDYSKEPTTLVVFELEEVSGGTRLTITESGFDRIPAGRRAEAFTRNDQGWAAQARLLEKHLAGAGPA